MNLILEKNGIGDHIKNGDLVITGEGKMDSQTAMGKAPIGVSKIAKKYNKPVIAFCGCATEDARVLNEYRTDALFPIVRGACALDEAMDIEIASKNMAECAEQVIRLWNMNNN